jgi:hypothetical protein
MTNNDNASTTTTTTTTTKSGMERQINNKHHKNRKLNAPGCWNMSSNNAGSAGGSRFVSRVNYGRRTSRGNSNGHMRLSRQSGTARWRDNVVNCPVVNTP